MAPDLEALAVEPIAYLVASIRQLTTTFPSGNRDGISRKLLVAAYKADVYTARAREAQTGSDCLRLLAAALDSVVELTHLITVSHHRRYFDEHAYRVYHSRCLAVESVLTRLIRSLSAN
jgi:four helix bundle protein